RIGPSDEMPCRAPRTAAYASEPLPGTCSSPQVTASRIFRRPHDPQQSADSSLLLRFVLLSMLLHALMLLVFGTSPVGRGAQRDEGGSGGLDVTLRRLSPEPGSGIRLAPGDETTAPGTALLRRLGIAPAKRATPAPGEPPTSRAAAAP